MRAGASIERDALLRRFLQTEAFCLTLSTLMHFMLDTEYEVHLMYSVLIGTTMWLIIDCSRLILPVDPETGWHKGIMGIAIVPIGILVGFFAGAAIGDSIVGTSTWDMPAADLRMAWTVTILGGLVSSIYFYFTGRNSRQQAKVYAAQRAAAESQLKLLETQLEPHMLFNTLANLRVLITLDAPRAQHMLDRLIAYLRATLGASRSLAHPLSAEFERLDDYLQLMAVRMGPRLSYTLDLPADLRGVSIPPLLLQPLVENAIKHGLEPCEECGGITVRASLQAGMLRLEVADNGVGMPVHTNSGLGGVMAANERPGTGFGLAQVRERLATMYGGRAEVKIEPVEPHGTRIALRLPIEDNEYDTPMVPA